MRRTFSKHMEFSFLFFLIIGTLVGYITITNARIDFIKRVSNDLYSNDAISWTGSYSLNKLIKVNNNQNEVRLWSKGQIELYINEVENNEILYVDLAESTRAIYFTDNKIKLPITSGRFFTPNDFTSEVSYAVIGKNFLNNVYFSNEKSLFTYENIQFEVIGILGLPTNSLLDSMILLNMNALTDYISPGQIWTLDTFTSSSNDVNNLYDTAEISIIKRQISGVDRVLNGDVFLVLNQYIFVCIFVSLLLFSFYSLIRNEKLAYTYLLLGYNPGQILIRLFKYYIMYILCGFVFGLFIVYFILMKPYYQTSISFNYLLIILSVNIVLYIIFAISILKRNLVTSLKNW